MPAILIEPSQIRDHRVTLSGKTAHHLLHVLRLKKDEAVRCVDGAGTLWVGTVTKRNRRSMQITLAAPASIPAPPLSLTLAAALLPQERWRYLIEKAVELGVERIQPIITEYTVPRVRKNPKLAKWQAIADGAAEQCERAWRPTILAPLPWSALLETTPDYRFALCAVPRLVASRVHYDIPNGHCLVIIGPEGGLSNSELAAAESAGTMPLALGPNILRAETAAVAALTMLQAPMWGRP
jgi:16S rRNA (uracil1498-N3)-methyltransferase